MAAGSIGVAVVGGGMAGRAHAAAYRTATTLFGTGRPDVRLVAVADLNQALATDTATRYGYQRAEPRWQAIAGAPDIDAVSVAVANHLHREVVEGLLAAGKHVLCEKPLATSRADATAMAAAADRSDLVTAVGYSYRWSPAISAIRREVAGGTLGDVVQFNGRYWEDYALSAQVPLSWRYRGGPGSGALADLGSHLTDLAEFACGPMTEVGGTVLATVITQRQVPAGEIAGHGLAEVSGETGPVENEDIIAFTARFASGAVGTFSVSRVAHGLPDGLGFEIFGTAGAAAFDLQRPGEFTISGDGIPSRLNGWRQVFTGPDHPYIRQGLPFDVRGTGHGTHDMFGYQARAFLDQIAGTGDLPRCPDFHTGLRGLAVLDAVTESARSGGSYVKIA